MIRTASILALTALSACAVPIPVAAPAPQPIPVPVPEPAPVAAPVIANPNSAKERFVTAVENNGCVMSAQNVNVIMAEATVGPGDLQNIVPALQSEGRAIPDGDMIRVKTPICA